MVYRFFLFSFVCLLCCQCQRVESTAEFERPNILFILSDDQTRADNGCYGSSYIQTPHIDQLAEEGLKFTNAFTSTAMCTPSRSALYTGLFPQRNGAHANHSKIKATLKTLPHYMHQAGYQVVLAGKVHVGPRKNFPFKYIKLREVASFFQKHSADSSKPFCMIIATHDPHGPYPERAGDKYTRDDVGPIPPWGLNMSARLKKRMGYFNSIDRLDAYVGRTLKSLQKNHLEKNTCVVYASDHGNGINAKFSLYDAGIAVPFIVKWPGIVEPKITTDAMVQFVDVLPTLLDIAGKKSPDGLDGTSFLKVISGEKSRHNEVIYASHTNLGINKGNRYPIRCVRSERFKYIRNFNHKETQTTAFTDRGPEGRLREGRLWEAVQKEGSAEVKQRFHFYQNRPLEELYDVTVDPHELNNLAENSQYKDTLKELRENLFSWMRQQDDILVNEIPK